MEENKDNNILNEIFDNIESVRSEVSNTVSFGSLIKEEGGHIYSNGLYENLDDNFTTSSNEEYPGRSIFK